jgi:HSP20 family protein
LDAELEEPAFTGPKVLLRERHIGDFQRSFTFPTEVDSDHMEASLANGLLRIVVPKKVGVSVEKKIIAVK